MLTVPASRPVSLEPAMRKMTLSLAHRGRTAWGASMCTGEVWPLPTRTILLATSVPERVVCWLVGSASPAKCVGSNKGHSCEDGHCVCYASSGCNIDHKCVEKQFVKEKTVEKRHLGYEMLMMAHQDLDDDDGMRPGRCTTGEDCRGGAICHQGECVYKKTFWGLSFCSQSNLFSPTEFIKIYSHNWTIENCIQFI